MITSSSPRRFAIALSASSLLAAALTVPTLAASHAPLQSALSTTVTVTPAVNTVNVKPTSSVTWDLSHPQDFFHNGVIVVSNARGSTVYDLNSQTVSLSASQGTLTWTPPATVTQGMTTSVLGRYTTDSVAWMAHPLTAVLTAAQQATLQQTGMVALPHTQLADLLPGKSSSSVAEIAHVQGSTVTFFGGQTLTVSAATRVQMPGQPHATIQDLRPGQLVRIQSGHGQQPSQLHVLTEPMIKDTVFTTGSDIGEPVHWTARVATTSPSVLHGDPITVQATDSYGDPATTGSFTITGTAQPTLSSSFSGFRGTIQQGLGTSAVVDHQAQSVALTLQTQGPGAAQDDHILPLGSVAFQPGPAAHMTMTGPTSITAGQSATLSGRVTDIYGNPVTATALTFNTATGTLSTGAITQQGTYRVTYTAPQALQEPTPGTGELVTLTGRSLTGTATVSQTLTVNPGAVAHVKDWQVPILTPGASGTITATVTDAYGNAVLNGTTIDVNTANGQVPAKVTASGGQIQIPYTAPNTAGSYTITVTAGSFQQAFPVTVSTPVPSGAMLHWAESSTGTGDVLTGTLTTTSGSPIAGATLTLSATSGSLSTNTVTTNAQGQFTVSATPAGSAPLTIVTLGIGSTGTVSLGSTAIDPLVYGNQAWTDIGIPVSAGEEITVTSTGSWASDLYASVNGSSGTPVLVGSDSTYVAGTSGTLYLGTDGTSQSGIVDALVSVTPINNVVPTLDLKTSASSVTASQTVTLHGSLMMGTTPVVGARIPLSTSGGTFGSGSTVTATTNAQGDWTQSWTAPASGSATIIASYVPASGSPISQVITEAVTASTPVLILDAGSQSLSADSNSTTLITGTLTQNGQPVTNTVVTVTATDGTLNASSVTTNSQGQFTVIYTAGSNAGSSIITASADGVQATTTITLQAANVSNPMVTGAMQIPLFSSGLTVAPGWALSGTVNNWEAGSFGSPIGTGSWSNVYLQGSATYYFTVPMNHTETLTYGIPAGGFQNADPATISINGRVVATVNKDIGSIDSQATSNQILWTQTFTAGTYTLTLASAASGIGINVYGLWATTSSGSTS